jgi:hypothetical protein
MPIFPRNNLPKDSLNWGREVEKGINNLESSFRTAEVNNARRDAQLQTSVGRLDTTVTQLAATTAAANTAQDAAILALQGLGSLDESTSTYKINADNVTVGTLNGTLLNGETITGVTIEGGTLSTSGTRHVEITGTSAFFYDDNGDLSGSVSGNGSGESSQLYVGSGVAGVSMYNGGLDLEANGPVRVTGGNGFSSAGLISGDSGLTISDGGASISGGLTVFDGANISGGLQVGPISSTAISSFTTINFSGNVTRTALAGGGTTGASIDNSGRFIRTTSSQRYKADINPLELDIQDVYQLEPKTFKRVDELEELGDEAKVYPGFIAEDLAGTSLDKFVFYSKDEDGNDRPEGIHYAELTGALLLTIKDLNARLSALEDRVQ